MASDFHIFQVTASLVALMEQRKKKKIKMFALISTIIIIINIL